MTKKHFAVAEDLIDGKLSLVKIAKKHGISKRLIVDFRDGWRGRPEFQAILHKLGEAYVSETRTAIRRKFEKIAAELWKQINDPDADPRVVQGAIDRLLRIAEGPPVGHRIVNNLINGTGKDERITLEDILAESRRNGNGNRPANADRMGELF